MKFPKYERFERNGKFYRSFKTEPLYLRREVQGAILRDKHDPEEDEKEKKLKNNKNDSRSFDVIWTTGARVMRMGFDGPFGMELSLEEGAVDLGRLQNGAPVLDNHDQHNFCGVAQGLHGRSRGMIGVVENPVMTKKDGRATLRLSQRKDVDDIALDMNDGIIRNISVGFIINEIEELGEDEDGVEIFRATSWEPLEISPVQVNADPAAQTLRGLVDTVCEKAILSEDDEKKLRSIIGSDDEKSLTNSVVVESEKEGQTDLNEKEVDNSKNIRETKPISEVEMDEEEKKKLAKEVREAEKKRITDIRNIVKKVGFKDELADKYIEEDKTADEVRTLVIDELDKKENKPENETRSASPIEVGEDLARKGRIEGMVNSILHRFRPQTTWLKENGQELKYKAYSLSDVGKQFAYFSLMDMARHCLEANGVRTEGMPKHKIAETALKMRSLHSTSDFPEILANVAEKTLRDGYLAAPQTWRPFTREVTAADFKEVSRTNLGDAPKLEEVPETGEVKRGTIGEAAEKYKLKEHAKILGVTRKALINDDLGAFTRLPERMGRRAADLESDLVWDIFKANAALADTFALFSAQHSNLSTVPAAPNEAGLSELRAAMRRQVGLDGAEISLTPIWLFVPPAHETAAEKLLATILPDSSGNVSPFSARGRTPLRLDVEPRLETGTGGSLTSWFGTADMGQVDMIELARLEGTDGPSIETREGFDIQGMEIKIMHDVVAKAIDFRGLFKNAGA